MAAARLLSRAARSVGARKALASSIGQSRTRVRCFSSSYDGQTAGRSYGFLARAAPKKDSSRILSMLPLTLACLAGWNLLDREVVHAESDESTAKPSSPLPEPNQVDLEAVAKKERQRLEDMLKSKGLQYGSYPRFTVAVKGQKVTIKFQIPPTCDIPRLISNLVSNLGIKVEERGGAADMRLRAWDSAVAWQLILDRPKDSKQISGDLGKPDDPGALDEELCILIFRSLISADKAEIEFIKKGSFTQKELEALVSVIQLAGGKISQNKTPDRRVKEENGKMPSVDKAVQTLESLGVRVYGLDEPQTGYPKTITSWENIAGYEEQKREIEDTVLLALQSPEVYDDIARGTRRKFESNRPRAVLFEGPPGTGKTSSARVISSQAGVPLLYVPLEVVMSKYYGESERLLGKVFMLANDLPNGAIVFLDEVDSFAITRDSEMHEATRRMLSVLLRQIDGFEQEKKVVVIAATNRKQDLDPALISRFDSIITFGLPDREVRQEIAAQYAKHLTKSELEEFATVTEEMSGRDIRDVCLQAERRWASKIIRGQVTKSSDHDSLPPIQEYIDSAISRRSAMASIREQVALDDQHRRKKAPLAMG
uniref:AAA+ ATPase domain-containing protein n=1 Tax=Kalanchoe fedtschenkoi TaxID=63787 RepID=A0A7N0UCV2_KALFE